MAESDYENEVIQPPMTIKALLAKDKVKYVAFLNENGGATGTPQGVISVIDDKVILQDFVSLEFSIISDTTLVKGVVRKTIFSLVCLTKEEIEIAAAEAEKAEKAAKSSHLQLVAD